MLEYFGIYVVIAIISLGISLNNNRVLNKILLGLLIFLLSIPYYICDYSIGMDTYAYVEYFEILMNSSYSQVISLSYIYNIEYGFY